MAQAKSPDRRLEPRLVVAGIIAVALLLVAAFAIGRLTAGISSAPSTTSAEAGFARDMQVHHNQAVEMSMLVRDLTDDEEVRLLAYDIATSQAAGAGQMYGWLAVWELPQAEAEPTMTWMTRPALTGETHLHEAGSGAAHTPGDPMPGYATSAQLSELASLTGDDAEVLFLELMIEHHKGGVEMAQAVIDRSREPVVVAMAEGIIAGQSSEIDLMERMLGER